MHIFIKARGPNMCSSNFTDNCGHWIKLGIVSFFSNCKLRRLSYLVLALDLRCKSYRKVEWRLCYVINYCIGVLNCVN